MEDLEAQQDELIALASIYDEKIFSASANCRNPGGQFTASLELPANFQIVSNCSEKKDIFPVSHLPPINLYFQLPNDYPSKTAPQFTLSCKWLTIEQLSHLCKKLDDIWDENSGEVVLFQWTNFLKDESFEYLTLSTPLDLTNVIPQRPKHKHKVTETAESSDTIMTNSERDCDTEVYDKRAIQDIARQDLLLATILEYDKEMLEEEFRLTLYNCNVCFLDKMGSLCIRFMTCGHVYCKECMKGYFSVQIEDGSVKCLTCPDEKCESQAHPSQVKELVSQELYARYDRLLLQSSLDTMSDIMYCPRKACGCAVMVDRESGMGSCPACNYAFCIYCKMVYHGVSACKITANEAKEIREKYECADESVKRQMEQRYGKRAIRRLVEDSAAQEWIQEYSKQCPQCKAFIQKIDGCNKMTCTKCRAYFCWLCNNMLNKANPYSHFNSLSSPCFNKLFLGVVMDDEEDEQFIEFLD